MVQSRTIKTLTDVGLHLDIVACFWEEMRLTFSFKVRADSEYPEQATSLCSNEQLCMRGKNFPILLPGSYLTQDSSIYSLLTRSDMNLSCVVFFNIFFVHS